MKYLRPALILGLLVISPLPGRADTPKTPQATLAAVMEGAGQALLYDRIQDAYVLVRVGDWIQGYRVAAIERDQLILTAPPSPVQFVLPKVSDLIRLDDAAKPIQPRPSGPAPKVTRLDPGKLTPLDPYGQPAPTVLDPYPEQPVDPYADQVLDPYPDQPVTTVVAPKGSRADSSGSLSVAPTNPPPVLAPATEVTPGPPGSKATPAPAKTPAPAATPAPTPAAEPERVHPLTRAEFDAALDDFDSLSREVQLRVDDKGVTIAELAPGTFLHRLGLRKGDRVLRVAGQRINDLDAAAAVYARLMVVDEFTVVVVRGQHTRTLRYRFVAR